MRLQPIYRSAALLFAAASLSATTAPLLKVDLSPGPMDQATGKGFVDVTVHVPQADAPPGDRLFSLPIVIANTDTIANSLQGLSVTDASGSVPITYTDDPIKIEYARHWSARRAVSGELLVRYRAPVDDTPPARGSGPPYSLRTEGGGVSAVGNTFILLPETKTDYRIAIHWDLSRLPQGSKAMSSYGDGDVELPVGPARRLHGALFMAGPMHREPALVTPNGFSAAWLGEPPFNPRPLMVWAGTLHSWMSKFFRDSAEPPYRVILRYNPINAGGGAAMTNSFLLTWGETAKDPEKLKGTLAHEMIHTWTAGDRFGQWYTEGNAVHYQALLPWRAGLLSTADFLDDLNATARRYYTNALNNTPDKEIGPRFWEDTRIRTLPYDRGAMYFAVLDGRIRRASGGKRSVDDLIIEMVRRKHAGEPSGETVWRELVRSEIGEPGLQLQADMLEGKLMVPESEDFGPCLTRTTARFRRFDLGFEPKSLVGDIKTIRGLKLGSEAALAGLKDGDVVTYSVAMDGVQGNPTQTLTLKVKRDGQSFPITYLPRGETVQAWQWARKRGVPEKACVY